MNYKKYYNYLVYEDGTVYSNYTHKMLKGEVTKFGCLQYTLVNDKGISFKRKVHRLVGKLFLKCPNNYQELTINHKDGNKLNNHYSNLEWMTIAENNAHARNNNLNNIALSNSKRWENEEWRIKTSKNISEGLIRTGAHKNEKNGRFRYLIYDKQGQKCSRTELAKFLNLSQSYADSIIKKLATGQTISNQKAIQEDIIVIDVKSTKS